MKYSGILAISATVATTIALPTSEGTTGGVQVLSSDIHGPDSNSLTKAPASLPTDQKSFLEKYQPLSEKALSKVGSVNEASFSKSGYCFAEYPCFSVEWGAVATIGDKEEVTREQVSAILDHLVSSPKVTFDQSNTNNAFSGLKVTENQATLEVIAPRGDIDSDLLAGMVFDMFKMQSDDPATNSIRAVQAKADGKERPFLALCLYPEGADATQAYNFCIGNELDGKPTQYNPQPHTKRQSVEGGLSLICGLIEVPLLCH